MARVAIKDIRDCLRIYYSCTEIGNPEIKRLFGVSDSKAWELKRPVKRAQVEKGILVIDKSCVNTQLAFDVWGIDVNDIERRIKKLEKLGLLEKGAAV